MKITTLKLFCFRNYTNIKILLNDKLNIFVGDNAQGKTNIIEAITILSLTKSHRVGVYPNIIMFNKKSCALNCSVKNNRILSKLEVKYVDNKKLLKVNSNNIKRVSEYISNLNTIIFTPDDLEIIKGSPNERRNLLNIQLSQLSKEYLTTYNTYNKLLKTRNEYLKMLFQNSIADKNYLDIITDKLIETAIIIYQKRADYIDCINLYIDNNYYYISNENGLSVKYIPNIAFDNFDGETIRKKMKHIFKKNYIKELNYGMTIYGPHRDDFYFDYNGYDLKYYGSQGQQKLAILSFKLSEIPIFKELRNTEPVILLDDIFSEFDIKKRNLIISKLNDENVQSIITTTDLSNIKKKYLKDAYVFLVKNGFVERK